MPGEESTSTNLRAWGSIVVTVLVFVAFFWTLYYLLHNISDTPKMTGTTTIRDQFDRSKTAIGFTAPLVTLALGYWFGADGKAKAEAKAEGAVAEAKQANAETKAVLSVVQDPEIVTKARQVDSRAFRETH